MKREDFAREFTETASLLFQLAKKQRPAGSWRDQKVISAGRTMPHFVESHGRVSNEQIRDTIRHFAQNYFGIYYAIAPNIFNISILIKSISDLDQEISKSFSDIRSVIERTSILISLNLSFRENLVGLDSFKWLTKCAEICSPIAGSTRFNWRKLGRKKFKEIKKTDYERDQNEIFDLNSKNILTLIDKASKEFPGLRALYNFSCEFVHPNVAQSMYLKSKPLLKTKDGRILTIRSLTQYRLGEIFDDAGGLPEIEIAKSAIFFFFELQDSIRKCAIESAKTLDTASSLHRKEIHKMARRNKDIISRDDLCPCGSGRTMEKCAIPGRRH